MSDETPPTDLDAANDEAALLALRELEARHRALDGQILDMQSSGAQNQLLLQRLKREKLALKDKIAELKDKTIPDIIA